MITIQVVNVGGTVIDVDGLSFLDEHGGQPDLQPPRERWWSEPRPDSAVENLDRVGQEAIASLPPQDADRRLHFHPVAAVMAAALNRESGVRDGPALRVELEPLLVPVGVADAVALSEESVEDRPPTCRINQIAPFTVPHLLDAQTVRGRARRLAQAKGSQPDLGENLKPPLRIGGVHAVPEGHKAAGFQDPGLLLERKRFLFVLRDSREQIGDQGGLFRTPGGSGKNGEQQTARNHRPGGSTQQPTHGVNPPARRTTLNPVVWYDGRFTQFKHLPGARLSHAPIVSPQFSGSRVPCRRSGSVRSTARAERAQR